MNITNNIVKQILNDERRELPLQSSFWNIQTESVESIQVKIVSKSHSTSLYKLHTFHKPVTILLDVTKLEK
jgi:hypothetical protein